MTFTGFPQSNGLGSIQSGALESSNVDLAGELTEMIEASVPTRPIPRCPNGLRHHGLARQPEEIRTARNVTGWASPAHRYLRQRTRRSSRPLRVLSGSENGAKCRPMSTGADSRERSHPNRTRSLRKFKPLSRIRSSRFYRLSSLRS